MKTFIYRITLLLIAATSLFTACNDKSNNPEPSLTNCTGCKFLFTESADVALPGYNLTSGNYRVFWSEVQKGPVTQKTYIKAPMTGTSFELTTADIQAGKVQVLDICPNCNMIAMMPFEGKVTGKNATPGVAADKAKWLIEAKIIRVPAFAFGEVRDTVYVKQYFTANFVNN